MGDERIQSSLGSRLDLELPEPSKPPWWSAIPLGRRIIAVGLVAAVLLLLFPVSDVWWYQEDKPADLRTAKRAFYFGPFPALAHEPDVNVKVQYGSTVLGLLAIAGLTGAALLLRGR